MLVAGFELRSLGSIQFLHCRIDYIQFVYCLYDSILFAYRLYDCILIVNCLLLLWPVCSICNVKNVQSVGSNQ